jgi:hypothetical protein
VRSNNSKQHHHIILTWIAAGMAISYLPHSLLVPPLSISGGTAACLQAYLLLAAADQVAGR